jgi:hypothetical protein
MTGMKRTLKIFSVLILTLLLTVFFAVPAFAFDNRSGTDVTIESGETVDSDLYLFGSNITINGTVNGDVIAFGQNITVSGTIDGSLTAAGQTIRINGKISRGVRAAGQTINVGGSIGRDLVVGGMDVNVTGSGKIGGDLVIGAQTSLIAGSITGNIKASTSNITISGSVGGSVEITGQEVTLASSANIKGNLTYTSTNSANIQSGATIGGKTSHQQPQQAEPSRNLVAFGIFGAMVGRILAFLMLLVVGIILIVIIPKKMSILSSSLRGSPLSTLGWGALLLFVTPIAAIIVMLTIIGLPLGIIGLALWGIALYLSEIPVALLIGWLILRYNRDIGNRGIMIGAFALGLFILSLLTAIPIIGWIIWLFAAMFGLGTLISSARRNTPIAGR